MTIMRRPRRKLEMAVRMRKIPRIPFSGLRNMIGRY
jgi:hypothetical protein